MITPTWYYLQCYVHWRKKKDTRKGFVVIWSHGGSFCTGAGTGGGINLHICNVQYLIGNESLYLSIQYNVTETFVASFFVSIFCFFLKRRKPFDRVFCCFLDCNYSGCTKEKSKKPTQVLSLHLRLYTDYGTYSSLPENTDSVCARTHTHKRSLSLSTSLNAHVADLCQY